MWGLYTVPLVLYKTVYIRDICHMKPAFRESPGATGIQLVSVRIVILTRTRPPRFWQYVMNILNSRGWDVGRVLTEIRIEQTVSMQWMACEE
jgi:hypothetical protein